MTLTAKEDLNVVSALNSSYSHGLSGKKGFSSLKSSEDVKLDQTNVSSELTSNGDVNLASGNNTTITASNLSGTNGNIIVGKYTDPTDSTNITYNPNALLTI